MHKLTVFDKVAIAFLVAGLALSPYFYANFPERVPTHWGLSGQPDAYGPRAFAAFFFPAMIVGIYLLLSFVPRLDPKRERYAEFSKAYGVIKAGIVGFMTYIYALTGLAGMGYPVRIDVAVPFMVGLLFVLIGNYFGKVRNNWFVGIRTPWTLSSEVVWNRTHRFGGMVFVLAGILIAASSFLAPVPKFAIFIASVVVMVVAPMAYSYVLWRRERAAKAE